MRPDHPATVCLRHASNQRIVHETTQAGHSLVTSIGTAVQCIRLAMQQAVCEAASFGTVLGQQTNEIQHGSVLCKSKRQGQSFGCAANRTEIEGFTEMVRLLLNVQNPTPNARYQTEFLRRADAVRCFGSRSTRQPWNQSESGFVGTWRSELSLNIVLNLEVPLIQGAGVSLLIDGRN